MIIVSGTKRSGTSMMMQTLVNGGFDYIGEKFSGSWEKSLISLNPEGFFESKLRSGVLEEYDVDPEYYKNHAVKIFPAGLYKTNIKYIDKVIFMVRDFRDYESSLERMTKIEKQFFVPKQETKIPPIYEWWSENYIFLADVMARKIDAKLIAYDTVLENPEKTVKEIFDWLGSGNLKNGINSIKPNLRTQKNQKTTHTEVNKNIVNVFDEYYNLIKNGAELNADFFEKMAAVTRFINTKILVDQ